MNWYNINTNNGKTLDTKKVPTIDYPIVTDDKKGTLIISPELEEQIDIFHAVAGATEWSGILLYVIKEGDISKPETLVVEVKGIFPMDIGTPGYTEYDYDEKTLDMYDLYPNALEEEWRLGHIHTHHNMKAYFSGTDLQELRDNIDNHAYYLSLIVNFDKEYCAKLCIKGEREVKESSILKYSGLFSNKQSNRKSNSTKIESIVYNTDLEIEMPEKEEGISFLGEILKLKNKKPIRETWSKRSMGYQSSEKAGGKQVSLWDDIGNKKEDASMRMHAIDFLTKLMQVDATYVEATGDSFSEILKKAQKKFKNMTENDRGLYLNYMKENTTEIAKVVISSIRLTASDLISTSIDMLNAHTSTNYGYYSYDDDLLADQVSYILEEVDVFKIDY